ncbi:hypothetical protein BJX70DRAFT_393522 [Aspergillus crustosus]
MNGPSDWAGRHEETTPSEALSRIDEWHDSGKPFFTKESIREVHDQLREQPKSGDRLLVKGLDGVDVAFEIRRGDRRACNDNDELTYQVEQPGIEYVSYQSLKARIQSNRESPHLAFCNLRIQHTLTRRSLATGKEVLDFDLRSQDVVSHVFDTALRIWEESEAWAQVKTTILFSPAATKVRKIIGLGCGTMGLPDGIPHFSYGPAFQHAFLLTMKRLLQENCIGEIMCGVQDPMYSDKDRVALGVRGIVVLDDPKGFLEVDDTSLVFACAPDVPVKQIVADIARPAVLIWDRVEEEDLQRPVLLTDPDSDRVRKMISQSYDTVDFPRDENFGDTVMYIRRESSAPQKSTTNLDPSTRGLLAPSSHTD